VSNIENVTQTPGDVTPEGKIETPEGNKPEETKGTPQADSPEEIAAKLTEKDKEISDLRKAVAGFQPVLEDKSIKLDRAEKERETLKEQLEESRKSDYESPNEGILTAQLRQKRTELMESKAQRKAAEIVRKYNLPGTLAEKIAAKPFAYIDVPKDATEDTIELDVAEQLPSYLDTLVKEIGTVNPAPELKEPVVSAPPAPGGGTPSGGSLVYADEIDPRTPGGYAKFKELKDKIESGQVRVLPSRKSR